MDSPSRELGFCVAIFVQSLRAPRDNPPRHLFDFILDVEMHFTALRMMNEEARDVVQGYLFGNSYRTAVPGTTAKLVWSV